MRLRTNDCRTVVWRQASPFHDLPGLRRDRRALGGPKGFHDMPGHLAPECDASARVALRRPDIGIRIEDTYRCVDMIEIRPQLAELALDMLDLARDLSTLVIKPATVFGLSTMATRSP